MLKFALFFSGTAKLAKYRLKKSSRIFFAFFNPARSV
jgi:hypothetical protein